MIVEVILQRLNWAWYLSYYCYNSVCACFSDSNCNVAAKFDKIDTMPIRKMFSLCCESSLSLFQCIVKIANYFTEHTENDTRSASQLKHILKNCIVLTLFIIQRFTC